MDALIDKLNAMSSEEIGQIMIASLVVVVSALIYWVYFYRRENSETAKCRKTLQKAFNTNNGNMWQAKYRTNWQTNAPLSKWAGLEVQDQGRGEIVTEIHMRDNKDFLGPFPHIFNLTSLVSIDFDHCNISGPIPKEICKLVNLTYLNLTFNQLTGGIPEEIGELTNLTFLNLNKNPLGGTIPSSIGKLTKLEHLWLANCKLTGEIPLDIGHLVELRDLILCENKLTGTIPSEIGVMSKLDRLVLSMNDLKGRVPASIAECKNLSLLYLDRNHLSGQLPVELRNLTQLTEFWLYCTDITIDNVNVSECADFLKSQFPLTDVVVVQPKTPTRVLVRKEVPHKDSKEEKKEATK